MNKALMVGFAGTLAFGLMIACGGGDSSGTASTSAAGTTGTAGKAGTSGTGGKSAAGTGGASGGSTAGGAGGGTTGGQAGAGGGTPAPPPACDAPKVSPSGGKCFTRGKGAGSTGTGGMTGTAGAGGSAAGAAGMSGGSAGASAGAGGDAGAAGAAGAAAGAGGATAGAGGSAAGAGGGTADPSCGGFFDPTMLSKCDECFRGACCAAISACEADKTCKSCLGDAPPTSCSTNALLAAIVSCGSGTGALEDDKGNFSGACAASCDSRCNPVTNVGCAADSACDLADSTSGFGCYAPPNDANLCDACDNSSADGPFCAGGLACIGGKCAHYCCDDGDCGTGKCDKTVLDDMEVGVCVVK